MVLAAASDLVRRVLMAAAGPGGGGGVGGGQGDEEDACLHLPEAGFSSVRDLVDSVYSRLAAGPTVKAEGDKEEQVCLPRDAAEMLRVDLAELSRPGRAFVKAEELEGGGKRDRGDEDEGDEGSDWFDDYLDRVHRKVERKKKRYRRRKMEEREEYAEYDEDDFLEVKVEERSGSEEKRVGEEEDEAEGGEGGGGRRRRRRRRGRRSARAEPSRTTHVSQIYQDLYKLVREGSGTLSACVGPAGDPEEEEEEPTGLTAVVGVRRGQSEEKEEEAPLFLARPLAWNVGNGVRFFWVLKERSLNGTRVAFFFFLY